MFNGVIGNKLQTLDKILLELHSLGNLSHEQLQANWLTQRAVERNLQLLVEFVIDVCHRLLVLHGQTPANNSYEAIERCVQLGILASDVPYRQIIQFRNLVVHRYEYVDVAILAEILNHHLTDFEMFRHQVLRHVSR